MPNPAPVKPNERIEGLDVIRGFALLGILLLNILAFGLPYRAYVDPSVDGSVAGIDFGVFFAVDLLFEMARHQLYFVVAGEWIVSIWLSVWWLRRYRFGPLEWLWRSLTYGHAQPMRLHSRPR